MSTRNAKENATYASFRQKNQSIHKSIIVFIVVFQKVLYI